MWPIVIAGLAAPALSATGHGPKQVPGWRVARSEPIDNPSRAIALAMDELATRRLLIREEFQLTVRRLDDQWVLWFAFLPVKYGEDVTVFVTRQGEVDVHLGY